MANDQHVLQFLWFKKTPDGPALTGFRAVDVFDIELSPQQLSTTDSLDTGVRGGPQPEDVTMTTFGRPIPEA